MNCFKLIKTVLDEAYAQIHGSDDDKKKAIKREFVKLRAGYANLKNKGCMDYSDPIRRFAYIYKYTSTHASYVCSLMTGANAVFGPFFKRDALTISTVGGGPGSDFLGVLKFCQANNYKPEIKCLLLDRDPAWGESWMDVDKKLGASFRFSTVFQPFDVTDPKTYNYFRKHYASDIFTLVYFMSEVYAKKAQAADYFNTLFKNIPKGAAVLFLDNKTPEFYGWFDDLAVKNGVDIKMKCETTMTMPLSEQKSDLGKYYNIFKDDESPKIKSDVAYRIGIKR